MQSWHEGKLLIENSVPVSHDSLHIIFGTFVWILFAVGLRRPLSSWRPWLWAFAVILWNETVDLWTETWPDRATQYAQGVKDLLLTMLVPTVLMFAMRYRPQMFRPRTARKSGRA